MFKSISRGDFFLQTTCRSDYLLGGVSHLIQKLQGHWVFVGSHMFPGGDIS